VRHSSGNKYRYEYQVRDGIQENNYSARQQHVGRHRDARRDRGEKIENKKAIA